MSGIIVSDTSCLILLDKIGRIDLLKSLFGKITIPEIVADEFGKALPGFVEIENPQNKNYQKILQSFLDPGEAGVLALALEKEKCLLIIDEFKGRRKASQLGLNYTGTLGILIVAKEKGLIHSVSQIIDEIIKTDFRIDQQLIDEVKRKSGE